MRIESSKAYSAADLQPDRLPHWPRSGLIGSKTTTGSDWGAPSAQSVSETVAAEVAELSEPIIDELIEDINRNLNSGNKRLQFLVHEKSGRVQLRVLDRSTNEVIREVPPEQVLDLVGRIHELIGLLVDETA